jgi:hypothetical protein
VAKRIEKRPDARFREQEALHKARLADYEALLARLEQQWDGALEQADSPLFGSSLAIHYGIGYERNYMEWCQWAIAELERQTYIHDQRPEAPKYKAKS